MRFKATILESGVTLLDKGFLPTLEKFGKTMQVLLGADEVYFVQGPVNTDGPSVTCRFGMDVLFESTSYRCQSKHHNLIAFQVEVGLLLRVLRSASTNGADSLEVKLTQKNMAGKESVGGERTTQPFLTFTGLGDTMSIIQDVPISKPYSPSEIDQLCESKEVTTLCPYYVDLQPVSLAT
ncbi:hypothetical protein FOA52_014964 [Chlamydomonas sp. UWO 241]|nr:hypothetical protein FOA52_014964 [Chlamydomonas sp. UWO 241]